MASNTSDIIVRNELEKYIEDLEHAIKDMDSKEDNEFINMCFAV